MKIGHWLDKSKSWISTKSDSLTDSLSESINGWVGEFEGIEEWAGSLKNSIADLIPDSSFLSEELNLIQPRLESEWSDLLSSLQNGERYFDATRTIITLIGRIELLERFSLSLSEEERALKLQTLHERNAVELTDLCKRQGGAWVKAAQFLSCQSGLLPTVYAEHLKQLQDQAPSVAWKEVQSVLETEWGEQWNKRCKIIHEPIATASIAQVHRATLPHGSDIALKIQLPHVAEKIEADLYYFGRVSQLLKNRVKGIDLEQVMRELSKNIRLELDYYHEASNLTRFFSIYEAKQWVFPSLVNDLLSPKILAMSFVEGVPLRLFLEDIPSAAETLLKEMVQSFIQQIFVSGLFHADPHPGNFLVTPHGKLALLDFGAVGELSKEESKHYRNILIALLLRQEAGFADLLKDAGFVVPDGELLQQLLFHQKTDSANSNKNSEESNSLTALSRNVKIMQKAKVKVPDNFILMARVLTYIGGILKQYKVKIDLAELAFSLM